MSCLERGRSLRFSLDDNKILNGIARWKLARGHPILIAELCKRPIAIGFAPEWDAKHVWTKDSDPQRCHIPHIYSAAMGPLVDGLACAAPPGHRMALCTVLHLMKLATDLRIWPGLDGYGEYTYDCYEGLLGSLQWLAGPLIDDARATFHALWPTSPPDAFLIGQLVELYDFQRRDPHVSSITAPSPESRFGTVSSVEPLAVLDTKNELMGEYNFGWDGPSELVLHSSHAPASPYVELNTGKTRPISLQNGFKPPRVRPLSEDPAQLMCKRLRELVDPPRYFTSRVDGRWNRSTNPITKELEYKEGEPEQSRCLEYAVALVAALVRKASPGDSNAIRTLLSTLRHTWDAKGGVGDVSRQQLSYFARAG